MAVLPGSLDYLYYNGILNHIPYEAYEMTPMTASGRAQLAGMGMGFGNPTNLNYGAVAASSQINATQYLQQAQMGNLYNTYTHPDTFVPRDTDYVEHGAGSLGRKTFQNNNDYGAAVGSGAMPLGQDGKNFRQTISEWGAKAKESVTNSPQWVKGLVAGGIIVATAYCLLTGKKAPVPQAPKQNLFQRFFSKFKK